MTFSEIWYYLLIVALGAYFIGDINFALVISKAKKRDVRNIGSGNPGTLNMTRNFGLGFGLLTLVLDMIKGGLPVLIAYFCFKGMTFASGVQVSDVARAIAGLCVILGHIYPVFLKFKGGKGIASTVGVFLFSTPCDTWWYFFISAIIGLATVYYMAHSEWGSMGSLIVVTGLAFFQGIIYLLRYQPLNLMSDPFVIVIFMSLLGICFLTWFAHRKNIIRLFAGEEHHTAVKKSSRLKQKKLSGN